MEQTIFQVHWGLFYGEEDSASLLHRCKDADETEASLIHPTEVTQWDCRDADSESPEFAVVDAVETSCGCATPAPTSSPTTSSPTTGPASTQSPTMVPRVSSSSSSSSSSVPLGAVIGGSVAGVALLAVAGVLVAKRRRDKRNGKPAGSPTSGAGDAPAASGGAGGRNFPVPSDGGGKNYPVVLDGGV